MTIAQTAKEFTNATHAPAANTQAVATLVANANAAYHALRCHYSYSGAPTGGSLLIKKGSTVIDQVDITAAGLGVLDLTGYVTAVNEALSATLAAGGAGVSGKVNLSAELIRA